MADWLESDSGNSLLLDAYNPFEDSTELQEQSTHLKKLQPVYPQVQVVSCDCCGYPMLDFKCQLKCHNCGFTRDCTDP